MKVYIVIGGDYDGSYLEDVFLNREDAEEHAKTRNKFKSVSDRYMNYYVVEKDVMDAPIKQKTDMLAIEIDGYVVFDRTQEAPEISAIVAEEWCEGTFDDIGDFIYIDLYVKASVDDFDLSREELTDKYGYIWEDVLNMSTTMKDKGITIEDIAQAIEDKYKIEW